MPRMSGTRWLGEHSPKNKMARYDATCVHTIAGYAPAHAAHFSVHADGDIGQSRDTLYQSAGNLYGNHRVIVIENEDHGPAFGGTPHLPKWVPLTAAQVKSNAEILKWTHEEHGVPLQLCPDSKPASRGLAVHRQGIDGNFTLPDNTHGLPRSMWLGRVSGGELWTLYDGKVCPVNIRIAQIPEILALARGEEDDMFSEDDRKVLKRIARGLQTYREHELRRDRELRDNVDQLLEMTERLENDEGVSKAQVKRVRQAIMGKLREIDAKHEEETPA